jgi:hypothetical protein
MPTGSVADVLGRLFGVSLASVKLRGGRVGVRLHNVDFNGILRALCTHSVSLKMR